MDKLAKWHFAKDVQKEILGDNRYDSSYLTSEMKELGDELKKRDWPAIKDEAGDVAYAAQMIAHQKSGINFPMIGADGSIKKFQDRRKIWNQIFKDHGLNFHTDYLKGGSNYARPGKVQNAFQLAGSPISNEEAERISAKHTEKTSADLQFSPKVNTSTKFDLTLPKLDVPLNKPTTNSITPSKFVSPFYGDKYQAEISKATSYNQANKLPNPLPRLDKPISTIFDHSKPLWASEANPGQDALIGVQTLAAQAEQFKKLTTSVPADSLLDDRTGYNLTFPETKAFGDPRNAWALSSSVQHELDHSVYNESMNARDGQTWGQTIPSFAEMQRIARGRSDVTHDTHPTEVPGFLARLQRQKFLESGRRFETPDEFKQYIGQLLTPEKPLELPPKWVTHPGMSRTDNGEMYNKVNDTRWDMLSNELEPRIKQFPLELKRFFRGLNQQKIDSPGLFDKTIDYGSKIIPGLVQNPSVVKEGADHHNVYAVKLDWSKMNQRRLLRQNPDRDPSKPAVYVGSTGLTPEQRFVKHKAGLKQNNLVKQFGVELLPELYKNYNPMPFRKAEEVERWLAAKLRAEGYTVAGGNEKALPR